MAGPVVPRGEEDVHEWAKAYVETHRRRMQSEAVTGRPIKPSRAEVTRAVQARFGAGSGRRGGILTWLRVLYWVAWILMSL